MTEPWVCGLATTFAEYPAELFTEFLAARLTVPLRLDHQRIFDYRRRSPSAGVGTCRRFAAVPEGSTPAGLLVLAEIDPWADPEALFSHMGVFGQWTGMSIGAKTVTLGDRVEHVVPFEVSLTASPKDPDALVIATGRRALETWELLTAQPALSRVGR